MNWKTYQLLDVEEKLEWDYKFKRDKKILDGHPIGLLTELYLLGTTVILAAYILIEKGVSIAIGNFLGLLVPISVVMLFMQLAIWIWNIISAALNTYKEHQWLKERGHR